MSLAIDTKLSELLAERIKEIEDDAISKLPNALPFEKYQQSCGYLEAMRQVREVLIPEIMIELQRS